MIGARIPMITLLYDHIAILETVTGEIGGCLVETQKTPDTYTRKHMSREDKKIDRYEKLYRGIGVRVSRDSPCRAEDDIHI